MISPSTFDMIMMRFASDDPLRPDLQKAWKFKGSVFATDGRIAILHKLPPPIDFDEAQGAVAGYGEQIRGWVEDDLKAIHAGKRVLIPLDFAKLRAAALAAIDDARANMPPEPEPDEDDDPDNDLDDDPLTPDEYAELHAAVILPDERRTCIMAKYARLIADVRDEFGPCDAWVLPRKFRKSRVDSWNSMRITFVGADYIVLLMPILTDDRRYGWGGFCNAWKSIGDAVHGKLKHAHNDPPVSSRVLLFGAKGGVE